MTTKKALRPPHDAVVRTANDLSELWSALMGDGGFGQRTVWLLFLGRDGRPEPVIVPIEAIPARPEARLIDALATIVGDLIATGDVASVALLFSRSGPQHMTDDDRRWARALTKVSRRWPIHLATADRIQVFASDDLLAANVPSDAA
jgi:hypothetical protein